MKANKTVSILLAAASLLALCVPAYASKMDSRIEASARRTYVFQVFLQGDDIKIHSHKGAVTLTGTVAESSHKVLAREVVVDLPGVKSVDERLVVRGTTPAVGSDAWLRDKVKVALLFHKSVRGASTEVEVREGIVTLRGDATSQAQKELSAEYAKDIDGVKEVRNEMIVKEPVRKARTVGEKIDDASITAQVKMTLLYHRSSSALNTSVKTKRGVVTLSGKAGNQAEIDLASKLARDVNGVTEILNLMSVN